jgi:hypothetical protein
MPQARRECEFYLLKYVPDPVRDEFVHVGVVLKEAGSGTGKGSLGRAFRLRFTADWRRVRCIDPDADTGMLEGLESELRRRFAEEPEGNLWHVLEDSFSNSVQMTESKAYLAESLEAGVEELMRLYVEPLKRERVSRISGRSAIQAQMRGEFERAGVWDLLRKRIAASQYTRPGDPLRIDCGYRNGVVKMFQAVSVESALGTGSGVEMAKGLAFSAAALRAGVERVEQAALELTAIVEPWKSRDQGPGIRDQDAGGDEALEAYRFAVETMEEQRIRVLTTADLGRVAETARRELRV